MFGSALYRLLKKNGFTNILTVERNELDLEDQGKVYDYLRKNKPDITIIAAAKVGGIQANINSPYDFLIKNLIIQSNLIEGSRKFGVNKIVFLGSSCIYPKFSKQPIKEDYLLTGALEETNEGYALSKISGLKACEKLTEQYGVKTLSVMPCNLYGPNDSFDLKNSHVLSALVRKFYDAKISKKKFVTLWGDGKAKREFMHINDAAEAVLFLMKNYDSNKFINLGSGKDISIQNLAILIKEKIGFKGQIKWDTSMPNGMPQKLLDISKLIDLGFESKISLEEGINEMIINYKNNIE